MMYRDPAGGNAYEKTGGSPQRLSPNRGKLNTVGQSTSFVSRGEVTTQAQTYGYKEGFSHQQTTIPLNDTSMNIRNVAPREDQASVTNVFDQSRTREYVGKENNS